MFPFPTNDYPQEYKEACFYAWYRAGRPKSKFMDSIPSAPDGRKPSAATVSKWMKGGDGWISWEEHADELDAEVSRVLDKEAIKARAKVLKQLAEDGKALKDAGMQFLLTTEPFKDNPSAAVRAIVAGSEMQFKYSGMAETLINIAQMDDKQLQKEAMRLLGKNENADEIIESDLEDVPSNDGDSNPQDDLD